MTTIHATEALASDKLAGELADMKAAIELVSSGVATRVTLTGLRFGRLLADRLSRDAAGRHVALESTFWPEDTLCDVRVSRSDGDGRGEAARDD